MTTRLGRFSFRRRWLVTFLWLVVVAAGSTAIGPLFDNLGESNQLSGTESGRGVDAIDAGLDRGVEYVVLVDNIDPAAASTNAALDRAIADTRAITGVQDVSEPRASTDNRAVVVTVVLAKSDHQFVPFTDSTERMRQLSTDLPGATVQLGGGELIGDQANEAVQEDLNRAELLSLPITLIVLLFIFGGIVAAGLPILAALATILASTGILLGLSSFVSLDVNAVTVIALLGLGLSIDYALLLVARYREELVGTDDREQALERAWATAGRTIMFSAFTVAAALTGLLAFQVGRLQAIAVAGIVTALVAMLAALTLTAAVLRFAGGTVKPSKRALARHAAALVSGAGPDRTLETGFFARLARGTQRYPLLLVLGSAAVLLAIAAPLLHVTIKVPELEGLPRSIEAVRVADELNSRFGQTVQAPVRLLARTDPATLQTYAAQWRTDPAVVRVEEASRMTGDLSTVVIAVRGDGQGQAAQDLVRRMRADRPVGYESWVMGDAAKLIDLNSRLTAALPLAIAITVLAMFVLLFLMTGSLVIPLKAIVMNLLALGATFGALVAVFQDGWLAGPLDTLTVGGLSPYMIVIVFAFAFGFSMDYEVFILGRIKEYRDAGESSDTAVRHGLQRSGWIITSAALVMLIVFACFAAARVGQIEQIGLGLFFAVLLDASIVRCLMLPATMTLLGRAAWWAPGPLKRLHARYGLREAPAVTKSREPAPEPVK